MTSWLGSNECSLPEWYNPVDPILQEFLREFHYTNNESRRRFMWLSCIYDTPRQTELGSCTLLKRTRRSKRLNSTMTNVTFINFTRRELTITVSTIATNISGCGIGVMGNSVTMDVTKTTPKSQTITIKPVLHEHNLVKRIKDKRILNHFTKRSIKHTTNKMHLIIPKCLSASTAQIDPCSFTYYLTVSVKGKNGKQNELMTDILHHSNCDVIFNDENIDQDNLSKSITKHIIEHVDQREKDLADATQELEELKLRKNEYLEKVKKIQGED